MVVNNHNLEHELEAVTAPDMVKYVAKPFAEYGLEDQIIEALSRSVALPSGGRIHIQETRACVAIDVDSGDLKAGSEVSRLNDEAAVEIARQIRLKNLSGKIVIDFAGSSEYRFMKSVIDILQSELADDPCRARVLGLSRGGNVEVVRQRRRPSLLDVYTEECPTCEGTGRVEK